LSVKVTLPETPEKVPSVLQHSFCFAHRQLLSAVQLFERLICQRRDAKRGRGKLRQNNVALTELFLNMF
jgi:hypothetical protein